MKDIFEIFVNLTIEEINVLKNEILKKFLLNLENQLMI